MQALTTGYGLIEGPTWHDELGLIFSDVVNGGVRVLAEDGTVTVLVPKRRGVGGIALHQDGGLVLSGRNVILQGADGEPAATLVPEDVTEVSVGFNDLTTDPDGRVWVGSLGFRVVNREAMRPGHLHVVDLDGAVHTVADDVTLTNGLGFSPDARTLYHSDSLRKTVRAYDVTGALTLSPWRPFATVEEGIPDGLAVAADGSVWVAIADGGKVIGYHPDGSVREVIDVPLPMVTSVCFGGATLDQLYIVTGSRGGPSDACGTVYRLPAPTPGLALSEARVAPR